MPRMTGSSERYISVIQPRTATVGQGKGGRHREAAGVLVILHVVGG